MKQTLTRIFAVPLLLAAPAAAQEGDRLIRHEFAPGELTRLCDEAMAEARKGFDAIAAVPPAERTVENTLLALERVGAELDDVTGPLTFMGSVSTDEAVSKEGQACEERLGPFAVEMNTRKDLYDAVKDSKPRDADEARLLSETLIGFEKEGLKLPEDKLAEVKRLKQELSVLESQFQSNLNNDKSTIEFTEEELAGTSKDFLARLKKAESGKYTVTAKTPDYVHVMENASNPETRRRMMLVYMSRGGDKNVELLEKALPLRRHIAELFGYKTWSDYRTWGRMAKDSATVLGFLGGLREKLYARTQQDMELLLKYKKEIDPSATKLDAWDLSYAAYQVKKRDYSLDDEEIKQYFSSERVLQGIFDIYSKLLGVRFEEVKGAKVWAEGVKLFRTIDADTGELRSYFYTDLYPRPLKYGHAAAFSLVMTHRKPDGTFQRPVSAIVANFEPPANGKPSLMKHDTVETFFHEFGHIMHQTLTRAPYASLSGTRVARDFVEMPSQLMENWAWTPKHLVGLSGHWQTGAKLPARIMKRMLEARNFNQGNFYTRQLMLGLLDQTYHTAQGPVDTTAVYNKLYREMVGIEPLEGARFQAGFGHLMGGYDAGYYGYLWAEVYSNDVFSRFAEKRLFGLLGDRTLDAKLGRDYRRIVLEQGRMADAGELLRRFLGREPSNEAFFKQLGIN